MIIGIDEVGRGCLAGPVCVGAAVQTPVLDGAVEDSKKLSAGQRQVLAQVIRETTEVSLGWASPAYIDAHGLVAALRRAAECALAGLAVAPHIILLDGNHNYIHDNRVTTIVGGDASESAIAAASIVAKVARDHYMQAAATRFAGYGFEQHVGYATARHRAALMTLGPSVLHRLSFAPLKELQRVN